MRKDSDEPRARYVWDRDKLAWIEAVEEPGGEVPVREESMAEATYEEVAGELVPEALPVEAAEELEEEMLQYRGVWIRLAALVIDGLVIMVINLIGGQVFGTESTLASWLVPIICAIYFIGFWSWRGQSLGKLVVGAQIVRIDGSPIGIGRAVLRYLGYFVYLLIARFLPGPDYTVFIVIAVGLFIVALSRQKRGLHDLIAGTVVINSRPKPLEDYEEEEYEEEYEAEEEAESYVSEDN